MNVKHKLWKQPWKYSESFIIAFSLLISGFIIEFLTSNRSINLPAWPVNIYIIIAFWVYIIYVNRYVKHPFVKWVSSSSAAISAITVLTFLILLMGFIPQSDKSVSIFIKRIGLSHVNHSWPYLLCSIYLMTILGFTIVRRLNSLKIKNIAFFLNHAGLWLVIASASLGSADMWKMKMKLVLNKSENIAFGQNNRYFEMPFFLELLEFKIEEFPPNVGILNNKGELISDKGDKLTEVQEGKKAILNGWEILFEKYIASAVKDSDGYIESNVIGSTHAAYVIATNIKSGVEKSGWICNGSMKYMAEFLSLGKDKSIAMTINQPKEYSSKILVRYHDDTEEEIEIEVNKPAKIKRWKVYQTGFDEKMGKWSDVSIIDLVKDPWLPVVYCGIFMMLAGSCYLVWMGRKK